MMNNKNFEGCKITDEDVHTYGVQSLPDTLSPSAYENKRMFDRLVKYGVMPKHNNLIDLLNSNNEALELSIREHTTNSNNPHNVKPSQIGTYTKEEIDKIGASIDTHKASILNPHKVTAKQVGAYSNSEVDSKILEINTKISDVSSILDTHKSSVLNPHNVTASQIGTYTSAEIDNKITQKLSNTISEINTHKLDKANPHSVSAEQIGAYTTSQVDDKISAQTTLINTHKLDKLNPHSVSAEQIGAYTTSQVDDKISAQTTLINTHKLDKLNPHSVSAEQIGAYTTSQVDDKISAQTTLIDAHKLDKTNPHNVTASQINAFTKEETSLEINKAISKVIEEHKNQTGGNGSSYDKATIDKLISEISLKLENHTTNTMNPHKVSIEQLGDLLYCRDFKIPVSKDSFIGSPPTSRVYVPKMVSDGVATLNHNTQNDDTKLELNKIKDIITHQEYIDIIATEKPTKDLILDISVVGSKQSPAIPKTETNNPISITDGADYPILDLEVTKPIGKNLFNINKITDTTQITNNKDGSLSLTLSSDTSIAKTAEPLRLLAPDIEVGKSYVFSMKNTGSAEFVFLFGSQEKIAYSQAFTMTESILNDSIGFYVNDTVNDNGSISDIQLEQGNVVSRYEPYLEAAEIKDITVCGKNILKINDWTRTTNGITCKITDGIVTCNGNNSNNKTTFFLPNPHILCKSTMVFKQNVNQKVNAEIAIYGDNIITGATKYFYDYGKGATIPPYFLINGIYVIINESSVTNLVFKPQIEYGNVASEFEKHREQQIKLTPPLVLKENECLKQIGGIYGKKTESNFVALPEADQQKIKELHLYNGINNIFTNGNVAIKYLPLGEIKHKSKNLFDFYKFYNICKALDVNTKIQIIDGKECIYINTDTISINSKNERVDIEKSFKPNTEYHFTAYSPTTNGILSSTGVSFGLTYSDGTDEQVSINEMNRKWEFISKPGKTIDSLYVNFNASGEIYISEIMLSEGKATTEYIPHISDRHINMV